MIVVLVNLANRARAFAYTPSLLSRTNSTSIHSSAQDGNTRVTHATQIKQSIGGKELRPMVSIQAHKTKDRQKINKKLTF